MIMPIPTVDTALAPQMRSCFIARRMHGVPGRSTRRLVRLPGRCQQFRLVSKEFSAIMLFRMQPDDSTHLTLLLRLRNRSDQLSWDEFHERYGELLYRYARSRGAAHADAEDIVQEVELSLFKAIHGFVYDARKGRFRGYLRSSVAHALGRRASKQAREHDGFDPRVLDCIAAEKDASSDGQWEREWRLHRLRWALRSVADEFEEKTLQAFQAHALGGLSVEETANELGLSKASVYQAKSRVIKRLKERLDSLDPDMDV